jgi:enoyl-CoA hydratase
MNIPSYSTLSIELNNRIATVYLNRPNKANAMNQAMWSELELCFNWLDAEPSVRVVILAGQGKHFCAGLDLSVFAEIAAMQTKEAARKAEALRRTILAMQANLTAIERCRKPVLAAIHYTCVGGAIDMISCCDMRYCTADAYFSIKEIDLGMTADVGTLQRLPQLIGQGMLRELAYTGRKLAADEALALGLVNRVYGDREQMLQAVTAIAASIASKSPLAIRGTKEMLLYARDHSVADSLNYIATWNGGMLSQIDVMASIEASAKGEQALYDD